VAAQRRRRLVVIYARYSSDEQDASSIPDQFAYCRRYLQKHGFDDWEIVEISDEAVSGELRNRPGIDQIWQQINNPPWDLLIAEDCSRLFRNESAAVELVETGFDAGMRTILINDRVDTDVEGWEDRLRESAREHARSNRSLLKRINRRHMSLWEDGHAIGLLKPGYLRIPSVPPEMGVPAKGPFTDCLDPDAACIIKQAYQLTADGAPTWQVANFLTKNQLRKCSNSQSVEWTEKLVIELIRRTIYRGVETYGQTKVEKKRRSGRRRQVSNRQHALTRNMEHLRIVSDDLWYRANDAITQRIKNPGIPSGRDSRLTGIPRDSRGPLSGTFVCGICGYKMYRDGRAKGGYRCGRGKKNACWNKATAMVCVTHQAIGQAIGKHLLSQQPVFNELVTHTLQLCNTDQVYEKQIAELQKDRANLERQQARLLRLAAATDDPPQSLLPELRRIDEALQRAIAAIEAKEAERGQDKPEVTRARIEAAFAEHVNLLQQMNAEAAVVLRNLIPGGIRAVPYHQFGSTNIVLRAEFTLQLVSLLPQELQRALNGAEVWHATWAEPVNFCIDLFNPSAMPKHGLAALALREGDASKPLKYEKIGLRLGIAKRQAYLAVQYGYKMREAGLTDPFIEVTEKPINIGRWRYEKLPRGAKRNSLPAA
jgi:hypothetical protein